MITTTNPTFNAVLDQMLSGEDRRLMLVTPEQTSDFKTHAVGSITKLAPAQRKALESIRNAALAQAKALDKLLLLCTLLEQMGGEVIEVENP